MYAWPLPDWSWNDNWIVLCPFLYGIYFWKKCSVSWVVFPSFDFSKEYLYDNPFFRRLFSSSTSPYTGVGIRPFLVLKCIKHVITYIDKKGWIINLYTTTDIRVSAIAYIYVYIHIHVRIDTFHMLLSSYVPPFYKTNCRVLGQM